MAATTVLHAAITTHFNFAELDVKTSECSELLEDCAAIGLDLTELMGPLEALAAADEGEPTAKRPRASPGATSEPSTAVLDVSGLADPAAAQLVLTIAGRYCALLNRPQLALSHFRAALANRPPLADAQLGMTQALLTLGRREEAAQLTLAYWRAAPCTLTTPSQQQQQQHQQHYQLDDEPQQDTSKAHLQMAFLLSALSEGLQQPPHDALLLLRKTMPLLSTPAVTAVESLAACWLPSQVPANLRGGGEHMLLAEPFVQAALASSRTFGTVDLEPLVCAARRQLLFILLNQPDPAVGGGGGANHPSPPRHRGPPTTANGHHQSPLVANGHQHTNGYGPSSIHSRASPPSAGATSSSASPPPASGISVQVHAGAAPGGLSDGGGARHLRMEAAATLACWCHFADFCMEETPEEAHAVACACGAIEAQLLHHISIAEWPVSHYTYLAAVGMYQDLAELQAVEMWLREPDLAAEVGRRLKSAGLPRVWAMLEAHVIMPRVRQRRATRSADSKLAKGPAT